MAKKQTVKKSVNGVPADGLFTLDLLIMFAKQDIAKIKASDMLPDKKDFKIRELEEEITKYEETINYILSTSTPQELAYQHKNVSCTPSQSAKIVNHYVKKYNEWKEKESNEQNIE